MTDSRPRKTFYVSIGNSDDKLAQKEWARYVHEVSECVNRRGQVHGEWFSQSDSLWQNACWCVELYTSEEETATAVIVEALEHELELIRKDYRQDSVALAEVKETRFV